MSQTITITSATEADISLLHSLIKALAEYEQLLDHFVLQESDLKAALFGVKPAAECVIASLEGRPVGFALFFTNFSTFVGKPGLYLEDLFVLPDARGLGVGKALLRQLAIIARDRNYGRMEWAVLDWNKPAIEFYQRLGATPLNDWTVFRMTEDVIARFAGSLSSDQ